MATPVNKRAGEKGTARITGRTSKVISIALDPRSGRHLRAVLRDPVAPFVRALAAGLGLGSTTSLRSIRKLIAEDSHALAALGVGEGLALAWHHLLLLLIWRRFQAEHEGLGRSKATDCCVATLRRSGVKVSKSAIYGWADRFKRHGLAGLTPQISGGRPFRIPAADWTLIQGLCLQRTIYDLYRFIRRIGKLSGPPISELAARRAMQEVSESTKTPGQPKGRPGRKAIRTIGTGTTDALSQVPGTGARRARGVNDGRSPIVADLQSPTHLRIMGQK